MPRALPRRSPLRGAGAGTPGGGGTRSVAWSHAGSRRGHGLNQAGPQTELLVCDHRSGGTSAGAPSVLSIRLALPPPEADPIRPKERDVTRRPPATLTGAMARQPAGASSTRSEMPINPAKATRPVSASRVPNAYISGAARALQRHSGLRYVLHMRHFRERLGTQRVCAVARCADSGPDRFVAVTRTPGHNGDTCGLLQAQFPLLIRQGDDRNRTGVDGFAGRCVATPPRRRAM